MSSLGWYWHRLKAMRPAELAAHGRRKIHQLSDSSAGARRFAAVQQLAQGSSFPELPPPKLAPPQLRVALERDVAEILKGQWVAFGYLKLQVEDPPRWHKDYLSGVDMATTKPALKLHHRLQGAADIKLMWEPSRWYSLVRLAQGAYVLSHEKAAEHCLKLLTDWLAHNPPYVGWNWTSGLETGLRLIQFTWIDALLSAGAVGAMAEALARVRAGFLPPHLWFTWRDRSFGSSANNHLLGELAGLITALVRWPSLVKWAAPIEKLQRLWEREVLTQFAPDGGNREQALNYHLFSWEFCWQTRLALQAAGRAVTRDVDDRLRMATSYFADVQVSDQPWDYGDSDNAYVTPLFLDWTNATAEWHRWMQDPGSSPTINYWIGAPPKPLPAAQSLKSAADWHVYQDSGFAVSRRRRWILRWDLSPLGYLATAGHGHCDALHLSIWYDGQPIVLDPGTGAYHADRPVRDYLASWQAHNGPHPVGAAFPQRRGTFLWSGHHELPKWRDAGDGKLTGELNIPGGTMRRNITYLEAEDSWVVEDEYLSNASQTAPETEVLWQFAPMAKLQAPDATTFRLTVGRAVLHIQCSDGWKVADASLSEAAQKADRSHADLRGTCSSAFRRVERGPYILLRGVVDRGKPLRTIFRPVP